MFEREVYANRRIKLAEQTGKGIILLTGNPESSMNYKDNFYPFRQDSTFLYFAGLDKPGLTCLIDIDAGSEVLYGSVQTMDDIIWTGKEAPPEELAYHAGIGSAKSISELARDLERAINSKRPIHFLPPYRPDHVLTLSALLHTSTTSIESSASIALIKAIVSQRSIKSVKEIEEITRAVNTTGAMQLKAMHFAREGMSEALIAGKLQAIAIGDGGNLSFPTILTVHGETLHNGYGSARLKKDDIILCDCGAETAMHYAGDLTRCFPVSGHWTTQQKEVYDIILAAYKAAILSLKPGVLFKEIHLLACEKLTDGLKELGLMRGDTKDAVAAGAHALFFQCGLGHMLGLDTHDMENLGEEYVGYTNELKKSTQFGLKSLRLGRALEAGFVLTIEPGLYFIPQLIEEWDQKRLHAEYIDYERVRQFKDFGGLRIEDDLCITATGSRILGDPLPVTATEIEMVRR